MNQDWLTSFPGRVILGTHISADTVSRTHHQLQDIFSQNTFVGSMMVDGRAIMFTDSRIHDDGFGRMVTPPCPSLRSSRVSLIRPSCPSPRLTRGVMCWQLLTSKPYIPEGMDDYVYDLSVLTPDGEAANSNESHSSCMNDGMGPAQTGRVLQRILEMESYRLMVLMGSPVVQVQSHSHHRSSLAPPTQ